MKKSDWPFSAILMEAVDILALLAYIVLQICYQQLYSVQIYQIVLNLVVAILVYAGLTVLAIYPECLNRLPEKVCVGRVRMYSLRMIRIIKLLLLIGILIPSICDVASVDLPNIYNAGLILVLLAVAVYYEVRIVLYMRKK